MATRIYVVNADGTGLRGIPGAGGGFNPVLSPDGRTLTFSRARERQRGLPNGGETTVYRSYSVWLLDMDGSTARQLTPWRNGVLDYPSAFSPDGSTLAISRERIKAKVSTRFSAIAIRLDGSGERLLARNAIDPVYSPDGTRLALIATGKRRTITRRDAAVIFTETELAVAAADGSGLRKLTRTPAVVEVQPSWNPSGQRLAYTHLPVNLSTFSLQGGNSIMQINTDGSCRTRVLSFPRAFVYGATWQPGPGREAGLISC